MLTLEPGMSDWGHGQRGGRALENRLLGINGRVTTGARPSLRFTGSWRSLLVELPSGTCRNPFSAAALMPSAGIHQFRCTLARPIPWGRAYDESSPPRVPTSGSGYCRTAGYLTRRKRSSLCDAADHHDRAARRRQFWRCCWAPRGRTGLSAALRQQVRSYHQGDRDLLGRRPEAARLSFPKPHTAGFESNS